MNRRIAAMVVAVLVPVAVVAVVVSRHDGSKHRPARLPIATARASAGGAADAALAPYGDLVYEADPALPALGGTAKAYRVVGADPAASVARVAAALDLHGNPQRQHDTYVVNDGDAQLTVTATDWSYTRQTSGAIAVPDESVACAPDADCPTASIASPPAPPERPTDLPSQDDAKASALALLTRAGLDTRGVTVSIDDGITQWFVRVDPVVDGLATEGFGATVIVGEKGAIDSASGTLGSVTATDAYPLIGVTAAIDRLKAGDEGQGVKPLAAAADAIASGEPAPNAPAPLPGAPGSVEPAPPASDAPPPATGSDTDTLPPPVPQKVVLTAVTQILLFTTSVDGTETWLVPAYRFTTADGAGPTVIAVDDGFLTPATGR